MDDKDYELARAEKSEEHEHNAMSNSRQMSQKQDAKLHAKNRNSSEAPQIGSKGRDQSSASSSAESLVLEEMGTGRPRRVHRMESTATESLAREDSLHLHPTHLSRIETHRLQHSGTVGSNLRYRQTLESKPIPNLGAGKPLPPPLPEQEEYVVEFDGPHDPLHGQNWTLKRKLFIFAILIFDSITATMGSSIFGAAVPVVAKQYHVSEEVSTLGVSFFVLGYAFGPLVWAPLSELYGRRLPIIIGALGFSIFSISVATGKDLQTILICRFFSGIFGSSPLTVVAAVFADIFDNKTRGLAVAGWSASISMGPLFAPFIGGFITTSYLGWRWTQYIVSFMGFASFVLVLFFLPETYPPVILVSKAADLRRRTKNWGIHAKQEEVEVDITELVVKNVSRPMRILFTEPIVLSTTLYMSFIYGLLYLFLTAYALVFQGVYGFSPGVGGLCYFGFIVGQISGFIATLLINPRYIRKLEANNNIPVPEWRLPIAVVGAPLFAAGLFWFGWTGYTRNIPWIVPVLSGLFTGFGFFTIFLTLLNYIVDAYLMFAASALAANTFMRSIFGAVFPLFATYMFQGIGINWGLTLCGCVALLLAPLPVLFIIYGKKIRGKSKLAPAWDLKMAKNRDEESKGSDTTENHNNASRITNGEKKDGNKTE